MLDLKKIRDNPQWVEERLASRGRGYDLQKIHQLERDKRALQTETENLQARRNAISREVGQMKAQGGDASALLVEMQTLGPRLKELELLLRVKEEEVLRALAELPNLPDESVPVGKDEHENVELRRWPGSGDPAAKPFPALNHWDVGERLGVLDFNAGALVAGARFTVLRGAGARLNRALIQFMLDLHSGEHG